MDEKVLKWLWDIKLAIDEIDGYFEHQDKDFFQYQKNIMLKRAIDRDLEIIGEAMNRALQNDSSIENEISNAKAIIGLRNQVIHAYDNISDENIWSILINHLPKFKIEVNNLITQK
ncbi:MAG: HepT-like ribonuclease domain-containing protein [Cyclobacteriaceae bacterium]